MATIGLVVMAVLVVAIFALRLKDRVSSAPSKKNTLRASALSRELDALDARYGFTATAVCPEGRGAVGLAGRDKVLVFVTPDWASDDADNAAGELSTAVVNASDVLDVEVVEPTFSNSSQAGSSVPMATDIVLKVSVRNMAQPMHVLGFLSGHVEVGSGKHRDAQMRAYRWEGLVRTLMAARHRVPSVNDQLRALDKAEREGRMTSEEAKTAKAKIMAHRILSRAPAVKPTPVNRETPV